MTYFHAAGLEHQRKRYLRADAYRFAPPGTPEAKPPGWLDPSMTRVRLKEAQEAEARRQAQAAQEELERKLRELRASHERVKAELTEIIYELAWRRMCRKYGYTPKQQLDHKYDGQPRDEGGRYSFGKKPEATEGDIGDSQGLNTDEGNEGDSSSPTPSRNCRNCEAAGSCRPSRQVSQMSRSLLSTLGAQETARE
jgi:hypothetical protein